MYTYKVLLGAVAGIAIVATGSYFALQSNLENDASTEEAGVALDDGVNGGGDFEAYERDDDYTNEAGDDASEKSAELEDDDDSVDSTVPVPPAPAPTPTPAPTPQPTPTPESSGYTLADVSEHADASSCWSVVGESVYDLTAFISKHPGGEKKILRMCGTDGTDEFMSKHGGDSKPEAALERYRIGSYNG